MKEMLAPLPLNDRYVRSLYPEGKAPATLPGLMFFNTCKEIMADIRDIQADETNPNDCAKQPHDVTHSVDGCRYFCVNRAMPAVEPVEEEPFDEFDDSVEDYETFMTGGDATAAYMNY
jgi:phage terminase large subunit